jgi:hypothetical protein
MFSCFQIIADDLLTPSRINEYIPRLRAEGKFLSAGQDLTKLREKLKDEAITWFSVGAEYSEKLQEWRVQRSVEEVKGLVKALIPTELDNQYRAAVMVATRKMLLEDDQSFGIGIPPALKGADGIYNAEAVRDFIAGNWKLLGDLAWKVQRAKNSEHMKLKAQKRKAEEKEEEEEEEEKEKEEAEPAVASVAP